MKWLKILFEFLRDLVCKCMVMCSCKSTCIKEQTEETD
jgi:hypothetical protein